MAQLEQLFLKPLGREKDFELPYGGGSAVAS